MANTFKVVSNNTIVRVDNTSGTLKDISSAVTAIDGVRKAFEMEDVTAFGDSEAKRIKIFPSGAEITIDFLYRTGSSDAAAILRALANQGPGTSAVHTVEIKPDGTRLVSFEGFLRDFDYIMRGKETVKGRAVFVSDSAVTFATSS